MSYQLLTLSGAMNNIHFNEHTVETPVGNEYHGLEAKGETSAVVVLRAGGVFEVNIATTSSPSLKVTTAA